MYARQNQDDFFHIPFLVRLRVVNKGYTYCTCVSNRYFREANEKSTEIKNKAQRKVAIKLEIENLKSQKVSQVNIMGDESKKTENEMKKKVDERKEKLDHTRTRNGSGQVISIFSEIYIS